MDCQRNTADLLRVRQHPGRISQADTIAMIAAACTRLGERALVGAAGTDYSDVPHFEHVKVVGSVNFTAVFPGLPRARPPRRFQHHAHRHARRSPPADPLLGPRPRRLWSRGQAAESGHCPAFFQR